MHTVRTKLYGGLAILSAIWLSLMDSNSADPVKTASFGAIFHLDVMFA